MIRETVGINAGKSMLKIIKVPAGFELMTNGFLK